MSGEQKLRVAVYGTLRRAGGNYWLLRNAKFLGMYNTPPEWTMYSYGCPVIVPEGNTSIVTEVYEIDDKMLDSLDTLEGYPYHYNRKIIDTDYGPAYIYFQKSVWGKLRTIDSGDFINECGLYAGIQRSDYC